MPNNAMLSGFKLYPHWVPLNLYGFMTHHWKACEQNKLKMPACTLYLVPGPEKLHFFQPPSKRPAHPEPFARLFGRHLEIFFPNSDETLRGWFGPYVIYPDQPNAFINLTLKNELLHQHAF